MYEVFLYLFLWFGYLNKFLSQTFNSEYEQIKKAYDSNGTLKVLVLLFQW